MTNEVGRPTKLTDDVMAKIQELLLDGKKEREVYEMLNIPRSTWNTWRKLNYDDFRTNVLDYKLEYKLNLADMVSEDVLRTEHVNSDGKVDTGVLSVKQRESQFLRETLDKKNYSKRNELTGENGGAIEVKQITGMKIIKDDGDRVQE